MTDLYKMNHRTTSTSVYEAPPPGHLISNANQTGFKLHKLLAALCIPLWHVFGFHDVKIR